MGATSKVLQTLAAKHAVCARPKKQPRRTPTKHFPKACAAGPNKVYTAVQPRNPPQPPAPLALLGDVGRRRSYVDACVRSVLPDRGQIGWW